MSLRSHRRRRPAILVALALLTGFVSGPRPAMAVSAAAPSVNASIEPAQITLGESARLTIMMSGKGTLSVSLPVVPGLEFRVVGQSRQIQMINGITLESTSTVVRVTPEEPGVFTIPGLTPNSPALILKVNPAGGRGFSPPGNGSGSGNGPGNGVSPGAGPLIPGGASAGGLHMTPDGSAFVHLEMPKHDIYVGESVPVEIQVGMRDGFVESLNGLPKLNSNDFTLNNLSRQPERGARTIEGKPFTVYTWRSLLAGVKPGTFSLSFETPLTVRVRTRPARESMLDDLLGDPFLQNIFGTTVQKNITAASPDFAVNVLPLPAQGRPADFGGAVGSFKISTDLSSAKSTVGDPLTLRMHVSGAGNFDRVESSMLGGDAQWKTYEPKATFNSTDPTGFRGDKTFEQPIIATQPGNQTIPPLGFTYFDPATRRYETAHSAPLNLNVSPAATRPESEPPPAVAGASDVNARSGLRPDHAVTGARVASLMPLYFRPLFAGGVSVLGLVFAGGWVALRRRERQANDQERERRRLRTEAIQELMERMSASSSSADAALFFRSARSALQQCLSPRWDIPPEQITLEDIDARLQGADRDDVRQIFLLADEANYSGTELEAADYDRWADVVRRQLASETPA